MLSDSSVLVVLTDSVIHLESYPRRLRLESLTVVGGVRVRVGLCVWIYGVQSVTPELRGRRVGVTST